MSNQNSRALAILERLRARAGLTADGRDALIQLTNPFTDFESRRVGYFDANQAASVVQCIKKSTVITTPIPGGPGNWDCNIFTLPFLGSVDAPNYTGQGVMAGSGLMAQTNGAASTNTMGPVNIIKGDAGSDLGLATHGNSVFCDGASLAPGNASYLVANDSGFLDGNSRLIGMGFEVHNTTSELYKQGSVAVYHQPQNVLLDRSHRNEFDYTGIPAAPTTYEFGLGLTTQTLSDAPSSLADALLLSGTRQWEAHDGCMCIPTLITNEIPTVRRESIVPVVVNTSTEIDMVLPTAAFPVRMIPAAIPARTRVQSSAGVLFLGKTDVWTKPNKFTNFNTVGAFFSGLSPQTTLVVNVIYYVERFPGPTELDLVVLAQPSPSADPVAAELYSVLMREMPPGVKVGDNADGDWFYNLISGAAKFLKPALMSAGPLGMAGSVLAQGAEDWANGKLKEGQKKPLASIQAAPRKNIVTQGSTWKAPPKKKGKPKKGNGWTQKSGMNGP